MEETNDIKTIRKRRAKIKPDIVLVFLICNQMVI